MNMNLHPAAKLIPEMTPQEFAALKADIRAHGQREPIITLGDAILDGRHRYRAVDELGYPPVFREYRGDTDEPALIAFVLSQNLHRRHLTESQRAMIAARIANGREGRPKKTTDKSVVSQDAAARLLKVSPDSVQNARKVQTYGAPALQRAVEQGQVAVTTAAVLADAPAAEQKKIIALNDEKAIIAQAKAIKARNRAERREKKHNELSIKAATFTLQADAPAPNITIHNRDARNLHTFVSRDVDLVFTSPPYNVGMQYHTHNDNLPAHKYRALLEVVFRECYFVMRDGARIGVNIPFGIERDPYKPLAPMLFEILTHCGFTLIGQTIWDKGQQAIGGSTAFGSFCSASAPRFRDRCEAILWAYKRAPKLTIPKKARALTDSDTFLQLAQDYWHVLPASHALHPAVFPVALAENAIRFFGYEGCHVLDPFAGSGTVGVAAKALNCRASLVEIDAAYCALAQERLGKGK